MRASILSSGGTTDGVTVFFYDGLPGAGGRLFDVETVPHVRANAAYAAQVVFRPPTCGPHTIVVVARPASGLPASGPTTVQAGHCTVSGLTGSATRVGDGTDNAQVKIAGRIALAPPAGTPNLAQSRVTLQNLLAESGGAGELLDRVAAGAIQLVARTGGKPTSAIFESRPGSARPSFRMEIKQSAPGVLDFTLQVDRAVLLRPAALLRRQDFDDDARDQLRDRRRSPRPGDGHDVGPVAVRGQEPARANRAAAAIRPLPGVRRA